MRDAECVELLEWALPRLELRWPGFRRVRGQVCKRIARRIAELELTRPSEYRDRLASDPAEWAVLDAFCRVTIARFFRDRVVWERLRDDVLPAAARMALRAGMDVRCWSAGCGSGEEPYGLSILFRLAIAPEFPGVGLRVVATDADEAVLDCARRACYEARTLKRLPAWAAGAFDLRDDLRCVRPQFRADVELARQDLRRGMPEGPFHVMLCRNLAFTYFDDALQRRVLDGIASRVPAGGFLVLGIHERLPEGAAFARFAGRLPIYVRTKAPPEDPRAYP